jgi:hypothetical protein
MLDGGAPRTRHVRSIARACSILALLGATLSSPVSAQVSEGGAPNVVPSYEGWEQNSDGSFSLVFGYYNRGWEEVDIPVGPDNGLSPGTPDQGQPTHFFPRRNRFIFRVKVPKDFGNQEVVWTITSRGQTEKAYGSLKPDYFINDIVIMNNNGAGGAGGGAPDTIGNVGPVLTVGGEKFRRAKVGETISLTATATDDGKPRVKGMPLSTSAAGRAARGTPNSATGLRLSWFLYRGENNVSFTPPQTKVWEDYRDGAGSPWSPGFVNPPVPPDGKWNVEAKFSKPGTYVLRALAHDGGLSASEDITFVVTP